MGSFPGGSIREGAETALTVSIFGISAASTTLMATRNGADCASAVTSSSDSFAVFSSMMKSGKQDKQERQQYNAYSTRNK